MMVLYPARKCLTSLNNVCLPFVRRARWSATSCSSPTARTPRWSRLPPAASLCCRWRAVAARRLPTTRRVGRSSRRGRAPPCRRCGRRSTRTCSTWRAVNGRAARSWRCPSWATWTPSAGSIRRPTASSTSASSWRPCSRELRSFITIYLFILFPL